MNALASDLRKQLSKTVTDARDAAEIGARKALEALAVHDPDPYRHLDEEQRLFRRALRAQARQLGDEESRTKKGAYDITHLTEKVAYDQWHRLLFARFLIGNNLLLSPDHGVAVSLHDCEELAPMLGLPDGWAVAASFAAKELPEIFRTDDPTGRIDLPIEDRKQLIQLVISLPADVFLADDSLGWVYQFWQAKRKGQVNEAGRKIGADELAAVTQLFTEDYMVLFLLHNTLGAWWAGKVAQSDPDKFKVETEAEARKAAGLPEIEWTYLRFIKNEMGEWRPAAGTFDGWPKTAKEIRVLDPCMGSGHFLVAELPILVDMRMAEEGLAKDEAVVAVLRDNLYGLELDLRCTQIAAFNLGMAAWKMAGYQKLPSLNLACSGLAPRTKLETWTKLANGNERLREGMEQLYHLFKDGPTLGSLINPRKFGGDLLTAEFHELQPLLEKALAQEAKDDTIYEMAVTARGLAKAAEILAGQFTLVATNVPYLGIRKQTKELSTFCKRVYPNAKGNLATCFVERCLALCGQGGSTALVTLQDWLFLGSYKKMRETLLESMQWDAVARLGVKSFQTPMWDFNIVLFSITRNPMDLQHCFLGIDVGGDKSPQAKAESLSTKPACYVHQGKQLKNPDSAITLEEADFSNLLGQYAKGLAGVLNGDTNRFEMLFWEVTQFGCLWEFEQSTFSATQPYAGREKVILWENGCGQLRKFAAEVKERLHDADRRGNEAWGKKGIVISQMGRLPATIYTGEKFDTNAGIIFPKHQEYVLAIWAFCSSDEFRPAVRRISQKLNVTNATLVKIPFDLARWQKVAAEKYPHGLPKPFSSDPTQWLFNGYPEESDHPLQVAVARLLGYRWPRQAGSSFTDCPALGQDGLEEFADSDGIVCISSIRGEEPAAERLRALLAAAYGPEWNAGKQPELLAKVDYAGRSLEEWLRNGFFEQHCALFHHRPFIWHIWDGRKDGFSTLVNYHQLTKANMEKLTYSYLGDWIRRQKDEVSAGKAGSDARLQAAKELEKELEKILKGEPPYDIFVRWKPIEKQPIGWEPDLNDGVRLNIRPFMRAKDVGKKGAGILRAKPNIKWNKDRGTDVESAPWFKVFKGERINDHHLTVPEKQEARENVKKKGC